MDSANNVSNSLINSQSATTESSSGFFGGFIKWIIIIILVIIFLAFLGFNVFSYLAVGTDDVASSVSPVLNVITNLLKGITYIIRLITGKSLNAVGEGGEVVVNATANVLDSGLEEVKQLGEYIEPDEAPSSLSKDNYREKHPEEDNEHDNKQNIALNRAIDSVKQRNSTQQGNDEYEADHASSSIQGGGKGGWCYIGDDRGHRSCAQVGANDKCMSGDIFPTKELCINPNLRR
jgi:hypothetical protein